MPPSTPPSTPPKQYYMDLDDRVRLDEGISTSLDSSVPLTDTPSSSSLNLKRLHETNAHGYSHASDGLPSKLLSGHDVYHNTQEPQDAYKQTLGSDVCTNISSSTQQPAENYSISERSINPSVCATTNDFDAITRQTQHMPNYSPSGHQPTGVGNSSIDNVSSILNPSNVYSGLQSEVPDIQRDAAFSSLSSPLLAHLIVNHTIIDDQEPSMLAPESLVAGEGTSHDDCFQSTVTPHLSVRQAVRSRSLLLKSSHASYDVYNNNDTTGSGSELVTDEALTSHAENFARSHKNTPIDFAPDHSQIDHTEESYLFQAPSPDSMKQDMSIEDLNFSPPSSPSISSAYMPSSSPIPSSSPVEPSFQTPPTSSPSSPVKDTQLDSEIPLSGFADQPIQSMTSPDRSTLPLSEVANSSNTSATVARPNEYDIEQLGSNADAHRLKSMKIPYPKRPSIAVHRLQQKKLAQPFRSPVLPQASKVETRLKTSATDLRADAVSSRSLTPKEEDSEKHVSSSSTTLDSKIKYRTARAAAQFKSPLSAPNMLKDSSLVRLTPTIQALERKLQILKRAVKVREDVQEEVLEGLVKKWTEAGREVAWEVWNLVKDNGNSDGGHGNSQSSKKRAFQGSWGWESPGDGKKPRGEEMERNWGWDVVPICAEEEDEEDAPKHTLGTMLMQLGVAPDTLGWNDEEGSFIER